MCRRLKDALPLCPAGSMSWAHPSRQIVLLGTVGVKFGTTYADPEGRREAHDAEGHRRAGGDPEPQVPLWALGTTLSRGTRHRGGRGWSRPLLKAGVWLIDRELLRPRLEKALPGRGKKLLG